MMQGRIAFSPAQEKKNSALHKVAFTPHSPQLPDRSINSLIKTQYIESQQVEKTSVEEVV